MCTGISICNEGPRSWKEVWRFFSRYFIITWLLGQKLSFVIPRTSLYRGSLYRGSTVKSLHSISNHFQLILVKLSSNFLFTNRDNRVKGSFLGSLSKVYSIMHRACLPTVANAKNNRVGLSENTCQQVKDSCFENTPCVAPKKSKQLMMSQLTTG